MIGQTISHYRVLSRVGSGGMGVVYEAEDLELGRRVALKFLSAALAADPQAVERFRREARAASALNHAHICTIHDIGLHDGQPFIVMELLDGQSMNRILPRPLPSDRLLDIAVQVADALEAAHAAGIVHRDVKPANVLITGRGQVKLLDFGLAKLTRGRPGAPGVDAGDTPTLAADLVTQQGVVVGTVAYMSPEQIRGEDLDGRTDLFSFGALLYELATGCEPFTGRTDAMVSDAILHQDPAPPSRLNPDLHPDLERIICKALEKDRGLRYQTVADMRADLERLKRDSTGARVKEATLASPRRRLIRARRRVPLVGAALLGLMVVAAGLAYRFVWRAPVLTERDSILIADFDNSTGESVFDDTLKQALTVQLQQSPYLLLLGGERVATTLRLMGRPPDERLTPTIAREVCQREGAKALLAGSIAALGTTYVITVETVNCVTGDLFATVQGVARGKEEVLQTIGTTASTLRARLGEALPSIQKYDVPVRQAATASLEALKLFSAAMAERDKGKDAAAVPLFERAVEIDPDFAIAWSNLGASLRVVGQWVRGDEATARAFAMRDRVPEQERYYISHRYYVMTGELDKGLETNQLWAKTYPRNWMPHDNVCKQSWALGDTEVALAECREALRLGPASVYPYDGLAAFSIALGRFDEARAAATQLLAKGLNDGLAHDYLARIAWLERDTAALERERAWLKANAPARFEDLSYEMAIAAGRLREAARIRPGRSMPEALAFVGHVEEARAQAESTLRAWWGRPSPGPPPVTAIIAVAMAGDGSWVDKTADYVARVRPNEMSFNRVALPAMRAALELAQGNGAKAVELLQPALRHGFGIAGFNTTYLRGLAFLQAKQPGEAAAEFERIVAQRGAAPGSVLWPLAHLGLARARVAAGDSAGARSAYERFLALWKDADPDLPVLQAARREYADLDRQ